MPNKAVYKGQWKGKMRHGYGVQVWPDGARYEGYSYYLHYTCRTVYRLRMILLIMKKKDTHRTKFSLSVHYMVQYDSIY